MTANVEIRGRRDHSVSEQSSACAAMQSTIHAKESETMIQDYFNNNFCSPLAMRLSESFPGRPIALRLQCVDATKACNFPRDLLKCCVIKRYKRCFLDAFCHSRSIFSTFSYQSINGFIPAPLSLKLPLPYN